MSACKVVLYVCVNEPTACTTPGLGHAVPPPRPQISHLAFLLTHLHVHHLQVCTSAGLIEEGTAQVQGTLEWAVFSTQLKHVPPRQQDALIQLYWDANSPMVGEPYHSTFQDWVSRATGTLISVASMAGPTGAASAGTESRWPPAEAASATPAGAGSAVACPEGATATTPRGGGVGGPAGWTGWFQVPGVSAEKAVEGARKVPQDAGETADGAGQLHERHRDGIMNGEG